MDRNEDGDVDAADFLKVREEMTAAVRPPVRPNLELDLTVAAASPIPIIPGKSFTDAFGTTQKDPGFVSNMDLDDDGDIDAADFVFFRRNGAIK